MPTQKKKRIVYGCIVNIVIYNEPCTEKIKLKKQHVEIIIELRISFVVKTTKTFQKINRWIQKVVRLFYENYTRRVYNSKRSFFLFFSNCNPNDFLFVISPRELYGERLTSVRWILTPGFDPHRRRSRRESVRGMTMK